MDPNVRGSKRTELSHAVRDWLVETDIVTCVRCHSDESTIDSEFGRGRREHKGLLQEGIACIVCHYNLGYSPLEPSEQPLRLARGRVER